eukprot:TRINITY_DN939_c0_g1_i1.p1 TRINITY_DN939_c0_g1~~TRINITY_DN939_c0_g1_i1.p1  ORF type:complete len:128 (-),score=44.87 TRINITY_DN939_c0_g1_i1:39-422(-)
MLVVGGDNPDAKVCQFDGNQNKWNILYVLEGEKEDIIHDVAWAPSMGRSYHLIATASKKGTVVIWKIKISDDSVEKVAEFGDHQSEVWRVEWNVTGTILASSGDDGKVRLWKSNLNGEWKPLSNVSM